MNVTFRRLVLGFTLIEMLVVMAIIAMLLTLVTPKYFEHVSHAKEVALKQNLASLRDSLDKFYSDTGKYPTSLNELVERRYLRRIPVDPITELSDTWQVVQPADPALGTVYDVHSGAQGAGEDGTPYSDW